MGWLADILQELPVSAALRIKLEKIEAEHEKLETELQQTKEEKAWLKAEVERLKGAEQNSLDNTKERMLKALNQHPNTLTTDIAEAFDLTTEGAKFHL
jgi:predicted RNase H-like nuclease (RuvC/YqgF family)